MSAMQNTITSATSRRPWNKGKFTGAEPPLQPKHVWAIRTRLQMPSKLAISRSSISPSTASFAAAMW